MRLWAAGRWVVSGQVGTLGSSASSRFPGQGPTSCTTVCLQACTIFCKPFPNSISAGGQDGRVTGQGRQQAMLCPAPPCWAPHSPSVVRLSR